MANPFTHHFERQLPQHEFEQEWERNKDLPLLGEVIDAASRSVSASEQFAQLPEGNQKLVLDMAAFMIGSANYIARSPEAWTQNFWGLYIVGSRVNEVVGRTNDLDLLSVGTFYHNQGFSGSYLGVRDLPSGNENVFDGFETETPEELPSEYNVGAVDRKYLVRATPLTEGVLTVDLNVVDLTFVNASLEHFKANMDVDRSGNQLPRFPLVEVSAKEDMWATRL